MIGYLFYKWSDRAGVNGVDGPNRVLHRDPVCPVAHRSETDEAQARVIEVHVRPGDETVSFQGGSIDVRWCRRCGAYDPVDASSQEWRNSAACADVDDPTVFFSVNPERKARARKVCASCLVVAECREFAISTKQEIGVWGGIDEDGRGVRADIAAPLRALVVEYEEPTLDELFAIAAELEAAV